MSSAPECLACGTCCFSNLEMYVRVSGDDHARLAERAEELAVTLATSFSESSRRMLSRVT
jgi:hypothetical protein